MATAERAQDPLQEWANTQITIITDPKYGRVTRTLAEILAGWEERTAAFRARRQAEEAEILAAQAAHLGVDVDLATGWMAMEGEAL